MNVVVVQGPWTPSEDAKVKALVKDLGPKKWSIIASHLPGRIGKFTIFRGCCDSTQRTCRPQGCGCGCSRGARSWMRCVPLWSDVFV
jgi:hypothetical protein